MAVVTEAVVGKPVVAEPVVAEPVVAAVESKEQLSLGSVLERHLP